MPPSVNTAGLPQVNTYFVYRIIIIQIDGLNYNIHRSHSTLNYKYTGTQVVGGEGDAQSIKEEGRARGGVGGVIDQTQLLWQLYPPLDQ